MKTKEKQELKNLSLQELLLKLENKQKRLFELKIQHKQTGLKNPLEIRTLRRDIACIKALLRQKFNKKM